MTSLWQDYKNVYFDLEQSFHPNFCFAIVTAYNPKGQSLPAGANALMDLNLQRDINKLNIPYRSILGCNKQKTHIEKSWALVIEKTLAIELAKIYQQNAIYWVEHDALYLVPVLFDDVSEEYLGLFSDRIKWGGAVLSMDDHLTIDKMIFHPFDIA